jgi:two-component system, cell cycle response regulator CpdR
MAPNSRPSILVLEDDDAFRRFLVRALTDAGYSVVDTGNANEAITLLGGDAAFDLLITDIKMPLFQPHGIAVGNIARLRRSRIKIIYVTGDPGQVPNGFIDLNETPLLGKPFKVDTLLAIVDAVLAAPK